MFTRSHTAPLAWTLALVLSPGLASAFDSGSTGLDLAFNPTVDTQLQLPPDGVFNFTSVNIPAGVTVTFARNATNTPATILATGDVIIAGVIDVSGGDAAQSGAAGDGNLGDDGIPGAGGPGGFDGGSGGAQGNVRGGNGLGPGGGPANAPLNGSIRCGGGGGGFGGAGSGVTSCHPSGGPSYGVATLLPLIGGSGGGGGGGGSNFGGAGGGGGGGALLIAASGTVDLTGSIDATGGVGGSNSGAGAGGAGGGGSGGAVRIVATTIAGNGAINAGGGSRGGSPGDFRNNGGNGGTGVVRLEAENFNRTSGTSPAFTFAGPGDVFVAGLPSLRITSVAGIAAPEPPTGVADISLPAATPNPVTVAFQATDVPVGNTVTLTVTPANGDVVSAVSGALSGTEALSTADTLVDIPDGPSVLSATVSFTVTASVGDALSTFAQGERVESVSLMASAGGQSITTLTTVSGKEFRWPSAAIALR